MAVSDRNKTNLECFSYVRKDNGFLLSCLLLSVLLTPLPCFAEPQLLGYRPQKGPDNVNLENDGVYRLTESEQPIALLVFVNNLTTEGAIIKFTTSNSSCDRQSHLFGKTSIGLLERGSAGGTSTYQLNVSFTPSTGSRVLHFCIMGAGDTEFVHQGSKPWVRLVVQPPPIVLIPLWLRIVFALVLMVLSGLFSGLNLGLMALDPVTLKIVMKSGTDRQKWAARTIYRVRRHGNYLLCTLLLGNVLVNSTFTVLLEDLLSGALAIVGSTLAIVLFGEIIPQAICSRYGLYIGAYTIPLTYLFMLLTLPLSLPISLILNLILGKELGAVYKREQILELLHVTQKDANIDDNELNIISGALKFKNKQVRDVMTKMENVFSIDIVSILDFKTIKRIYDSGFSRIPIYEGEKSNIVGVLYLRDLTFIDPDDCTPVEQVRDFYNRKIWTVWDDSSLNDVLLEFVEGTHHLAVVQTVMESENGDNYYKVLGIVTLEDLIEEILGREIVDEYDQYVDNVTLKPLPRRHIDVGDEMYTTPLITLAAPQLLAVKQFLAATQAFSEKRVSKSILNRLLQQDVVFQISVEESRERDFSLYKEGVPANYFTLVLEGCLSVSIGNEGMKFEARAFYHFGEKCLLDAIERSTAKVTEIPTYVPDFTVRPVTDCLILLVTRSRYLAAYQASLLEQESQQHSTVAVEHLAAGPHRGVNGDVFTEKWRAAETTDLQSSLVEGGGLSSITRLLQTKPLQRIRTCKKLSLTKEQEEEEDVAKDLAVHPPTSNPTSPSSSRTSSFVSDNSYNLV